jgi:hypothetical protein
MELEVNRFRVKHAVRAAFTWFRWSRSFRTNRWTSLMATLCSPEIQIKAAGENEPSQPPPPADVTSNGQTAAPPYPGERYPQTRQRLLTQGFSQYSAIALRH